MHTNRKLRTEAPQATLQLKSWQETLSEKDLIEEKLVHLQVFIDHLAHTDQGLAEIERRTRCFGQCKRIDGETSGKFYARLRHWLDRDMPRSIAILDARQTVPGRFQYSNERERR